MKIKELLPKVQKNVSLAKYTTFKIGGPARYFCVAKTEKDLIKAVEAAVKCKSPFFILGGGSNLLIADEGYKGLIIKIQNSNLKIQNYNLKSKINCGAGVKLADLVKLSLDKGLTGLEWAAGIPGTLGGAIRGNAGAFNNSMANIVKNMKVLEMGGPKNQKSKIKNQKHILKIKKFSNKDCEFGYRDSVFKHKPNLIILSCKIILKRGKGEEMGKKIKKILQERTKIQPLNFPSAGSIFKNTKKFPAGILIEKCGLKGKKIGKAKISEKHGNFIINLGNAKARDVKKLIDLIKKKVKNKFGIVLKEEIQLLGF